MTSARAVCFRLAAAAFLGCACAAVAFDLRAPRPPAGSPFSITFDATPGIFYTVEASSNLLSWEILRTLRAPSAAATWSDTNSLAVPLRYYRVADLSDKIVVEGWVNSPDGIGIPTNCPFCDILVSSSLDGSTTYTDLDGHYILRTTAAAASTNLPFTLYFSKLGFRAYSAVVTQPTDARLEIMTLAGPSNNDFSNRFVISGSMTNRDNNAQADVEADEPGAEPSVWYSFTAPADGTLRFVVDTTDFLPVIDFFKGDTIKTLQPVNRGTVSNWVEWRIEITRDLTVYAGEQLQIRVGADAHPTRGINGGDFEWRCVFAPDFPLEIEPTDTNQGRVAQSPLPNANGRYRPGSLVNVQALPTTNYLFVGWSGSVESTEPSIAVTMDEAKYLVPHFQLENGSISNAIVITNGYPAGEGWIAEDAVLWYSWTPSRLTPLSVSFQSTNFFHSAIYRMMGTNLVYVTNGGDFWASNGVTYLVSLYLEKNQAGYCRFSSYEPVVLQGRVHGPYRYNLTGIMPSGDRWTFYVYPNYPWYSDTFAIWTGRQFDPALFPQLITISAPGYRPSSATIFMNGDFPTFTLPFSGPENNDFTNRTVLSGLSGFDSGWLTFAEIEPGEQGPGEGSTWYQFTPPEDGTLQINVTTRVATNVTVWSGSAVEALQLHHGWLLGRTATDMTTEWAVAGGDPSLIRIAGFTNGNGQVYLAYHFIPGFPLQATNPEPQAGTLVVTPSSDTNRYASGTSITIQAIPQAGYRFVGWTGDIPSTNNPLAFTMDSLKLVQANFALVNDDFANAITLAGLPVTAAGTNLYGTPEPNEPPHGGFSATSSAWWRWIAPVDGDVEIDFEFDVSIVAAVYTGTQLSNLVPVADNITGRDVRQIRFTARAQETYWIAVDAFGGDGGPYSFTISPITEARYVLFTGPVDGGYAVADPEPDGNTEYAAGTDVTLQAVTVNAWQFVRWEDWSSGSPVDLGSNSVLVVHMNTDRRILPRFMPAGAPRLNDNFADRLVVFSSAPPLVASNVAATAEPGEPLHAPNASGHSLWWSWTATQTAPVAFSTAGSDFTNVIAIYTGTAVSNLTRLVSNQGGGGPLASQVSFAAEAGTTYHIAVDGVDGATGTVRLRTAENEEFALDFVSPDDQSSFVAPAQFDLQIQALNSDLSITQVNLTIRGVRVHSTTNLAPTFSYSNVPPGIYTFTVAAQDIYARTVSVTRTFYVHNYAFATNSIVAYERDGVATFHITRSGPTGVTSSVYFDMQPGTAVDGIDYFRCAGPVTFIGAETNLVVMVPLAGEPAVEPTRTFTLTLSSGPKYAPAHTANVTLIDQNPTDTEAWIDDALPANATVTGSFNWISANPAPASGAYARESSGTHGYSDAAGATGMYYVYWSVLAQDIYLDADRPPGLVSIAWTFGPYGPYYSGAACWGDRTLAAGHGTWLGPLPTAGKWSQLKIPYSVLGSPRINGMTWTAVGGRAVWDRTIRQSLQ